MYEDTYSASLDSFSFMMYSEEKLCICKAKNNTFVALFHDTYAFILMTLGKFKETHCSINAQLVQLVPPTHST